MVTAMLRMRRPLYLSSFISKQKVSLVNRSNDIRSFDILSSQLLAHIT